MYETPQRVGGGGWFLLPYMTPTVASSVETREQRNVWKA
jgi:hypothetical protein